MKIRSVLRRWVIKKVPVLAVECLQVDIKIFNTYIKLYKVCVLVHKVLLIHVIRTLYNLNFIKIG